MNEPDITDGSVRTRPIRGDQIHTESDLDIHDQNEESPALFEDLDSDFDSDK